MRSIGEPDIRSFIWPLLFLFPLLVRISADFSLNSFHIPIWSYLSSSPIHRPRGVGHSLYGAAFTNRILCCGSSAVSGGIAVLRSFMNLDWSETGALLSLTLSLTSLSQSIKIGYRKLPKHLKLTYCPRKIPWLESKTFQSVSWMISFLDTYILEKIEEGTSVEGPLGCKK